MVDMRKRSSVPQYLRWLFWDTDPSTLDLERHRKYVIERVLEFGNDAAYRWLLATFSQEDIVAVVKTSSRISRRTAVMMANFYGLSKGEVHCLRDA